MPDSKRKNLKTKSITVRLNANEARKVEALCNQKGLSYTDLFRYWIAQIPEDIDDAS